MARGDRRHVVTFQNPGPAVADGDGGYTQTVDRSRPADVAREHRAGDVQPISSASRRGP